MSQVYAKFYLDNDVLLDLQPYLDEANVDTTLWSAGMIGPYTKDGNLHAAPMNWDTVGLLYNKALFDEAGVAYPDATWTWDDFAEAAEKLTNVCPGVFGADAGLGYQEGYGNFIAATGTAPVVNNERTGCTLAEPGSVEALTFLQGLYQAGFMPSKAIASTDSFALFGSEQVAMSLRGSWNLQRALDEVTFDWGVAPQPKYLGTNESHSILHAVGYAATKASDQPELASNLILYLVSDEGQRTWTETGGIAPSNPSPALQEAYAATVVLKG